MSIFIPKEGEEYWSINHLGNIDKSEYIDAWDIDKANIKSGNCPQAEPVLPSGNLL